MPLLRRVQVSVQYQAFVRRFQRTPAGSYAAQRAVQVRKARRFNLLRGYIFLQPSPGDILPCAPPDT